MTNLILSYNVFDKKLDHKCTSLIYVTFILFGGISKSILFRSILKFAILSVFNVRNVIIWHCLGAEAPISLQLEKICTPTCRLPPPSILKLPPRHTQYSKPTYAYGFVVFSPRIPVLSDNEQETMKGRMQSSPS